MASYRFAEPADLVEEPPPACSEECIWYEPGEGKTNCINRHEIICSQRRMEIFSNNDVKE
ncbi:MAG: hypothetical protein JRG97_09480 [Deltaproteobacteria bacterium]|nr:hypothetical protein [Deltaproteobacteria bacterium]